MEPAMGIDLMRLALYKAAVEGKHEDYYKALLQQDDGLEVMPNGNTVLHVAALHGHENFVENILQGNDNHACAAALSLLFAHNKKNESVLHCAAETGNANIVSILISATKDVESGSGATRRMIQMRDNVMDTALHKAVGMGHLEVVKLLVEEDVEFVYPPNIVGETPIYIAAKLGFHDCLQQLLETCKYPTYGGPLGQNALHATVLSSPECAKLLLEKEISLCEMTDDSGWTALHYAIKIHDNKTARMILAGKSCAAYICAGKGDKWTTVFHIAARYGNVEMMKHISNSCPDCWMMLNSKCQNVLHEVVLQHRLNLIKYVLKHPQADNLIVRKDGDGNTPLDLLSICSCQSLIGVAMLLMWNHLVINKQHQTPLGWKVIGKGGKIGGKKPKQRKDDVDIDKDIDFMVKTSQTNIIVASLVLTVTFTVGLTVPGGYNSNFGKPGGYPMLLHDFRFQAFVICDCIAFICSILSILCHTVMIAETSSTKNYELIKQYYEWNTTTILYAALFAVSAFISGMFATLEPLRYLNFVVSVLSFWAYIGMFWLSIIILSFHESFRLPRTFLLPPTFTTLKNILFWLFCTPSNDCLLN